MYYKLGFTKGWRCHSDGEIRNACGILVERLWEAATRRSRKTWQKNRMMCHGIMDIGGVQIVSNDVVPYQIFQSWGFIYLIVVCLATPLSTHYIDWTIVGLETMLSWLSCGYYPNIRPEGKKTKKLADLGADVWDLDLTYTLIGLVSPGGNTEQSVQWSLAISMQLMAQWWRIRKDTAIVILLEACSVAKPSRELFITQQASVRYNGFTTFPSGVTFWTNRTVSDLITSVLEFGRIFLNCRTRSNVMPPRRLSFIILLTKKIYNQPCPPRGLGLHI